MEDKDLQNLIANVGTMIHNLNGVIKICQDMALQLVDQEARLKALEHAPRLVASTETQVIERDSTGQMVGIRGRTQHEYEA